MVTSKPIGTRVHLLTTHFSVTALADSQLRQVELMVQAARLQLAPTQGCQNCDVHGRCSVSVISLLCSAHRHQPKGTAVLQRWNSRRSVQHSQAFLGHYRHVYWNMRCRKHTTKMLYTVEGSRLQSQGCTRCITTSAHFKWSKP